MATTEIDEIRQPHETTAAWRGRLRRQRNAAVDALGLKDGDPIMYAGRMRRFESKTMTKADVSYQNIRRLDNAEIARLEAEENEKRDRNARWAAQDKERKAFDARPEVQAASSVRYALENHLKDVLDRLSVDEWQALAAKLEAPMKAEYLIGNHEIKVYIKAVPR